MAELRVLEKKKRELEKLVNARKEQENALRERIRKAEGAKADAEAAMQKAAETDDMMEYKAAKDNRDAAQDLIDFCGGRLSAIDVPFDPAVCSAAINAVEKEYRETEHAANVKLAGLIDDLAKVCDDLLSALDSRKGFCAWVKNDLLREKPGLEMVGELQEIRQFKNVLKAKQDNSLFYKDGKR